MVIDGDWRNLHSSQSQLPRQSENGATALKHCRSLSLPGSVITIVPEQATARDLERMDLSFSKEVFHLMYSPMPGISLQRGILPLQV